MKTLTKKSEGKGSPASAETTRDCGGPPISRAAERMRRCRQRQRKGLRYLGLEIREREIDALVRQGLLRPEQRDQNSDIKRAFYRFLDRTLGE